MFAASRRSFARCSPARANSGHVRRRPRRAPFSVTIPPPAAPLYDAVLVPVLQRIQHEFGHIKQEEIERYSAETGTPQYRLWAVASFFPHFQLTPPKRVTVKVCRDMACHLAGSAE